MNFLLDTNIVLIYLRDSVTLNYIDANFNPFGPGNLAAISVVTEGELEAIALKNNWGEKRIQRLREWLKKLPITPIHVDSIIQKYAEIDAFSQGKLTTIPLRNSSRNMGKNDLWIAATTSATGATLLTTDQDFDHLDGAYLKLERIELQK